TIEPIHQDEADKRADLVIKGRFDDASAASPIGLLVDQEIFGWDNPGRRQFLLFQYLVENTGNLNINSLHRSMFADWDLLSGSQNRNGANYNQALAFSYTEDLRGNNPNQYGFSLLSEGVFSAYAVSQSSTFVFNTLSKYTAMSAALSASTGVIGYPGGSDVSQFVNAGSRSLAAGERDTIAFAMIVGQPADITSIHAEAQRAWLCEVKGEGPNEAFGLSTALATSGTPIIFTDTNPKASTWAWDFGDGTNSNLQSPVHSFQAPGNYLVRLTVSDGYCTQNHSKLLSVQQSVGIEDDITSASMIRPNPNDGRFVLVTESDIQGWLQLTLLDIQGKMVWEKRLWKSAGESTVDITTTLPAGFYVMQGEIGGKRLYVRMVVE
ncbi:MAG: PKD domain-containing protein, partial [Bacteroidia bacterium]|nr:PKD domain-containing protein [Bacteroidia bacterium]